MEQLGLGRTPVREALRDARAGEARRRLPAPRHLRLGSRRAATSRGSRRCGSCSRASAARLAAERATPTRRTASCDRRVAASSELPAGGSSGEPRRARADRRSTSGIHRHVYRCTHNPFLEATLDEYYVAHAADLVPRARSRGAPRRRRPRASRAAGGDPRRGRRRAEAVMRAPRRRLRAGDPRRALTLYLAFCRRYISTGEPHR